MTRLLRVLFVGFGWGYIAPLDRPNIPWPAHAWVILSLYCAWQLMLGAWQDIASRRN